MKSKPLTEADRAKFPDCRFRAIHIGEDAVAMIVSRDVWEGGVKALSREQLKDIYEGRIRNWKQAGGPDRRIAFFNKEPGRGISACVMPVAFRAAGAGGNRTACTLPLLRERKNSVCCARGIRIYGFTPSILPP